jgi:hypothetical protein
MKLLETIDDIILSEAIKSIEMIRKYEDYTKKPYVVEQVNAIIEKLSSNQLRCVPCDIGWSDVGSWDALVEVTEGFPFDGKTLKKQPVQISSKNNSVFANQNKRYGFVGCDDLIVVDTADALMVCKKNESQKVSGLDNKRREEILLLKKQSEERKQKLAFMAAEKEFESENIRRTYVEEVMYEKVVILVAYSSTGNSNSKYFGYVNYGNGKGSIELTENEYRVLSAKYKDVYTREK